MEQARVAAIGDSDFVMPFSTLGVDTYPVQQRQADIAENARKIVHGKYALVVVAENIAESADEVFREYENEPTSCTVVVPFTTESKGYATRALGRILKMATGIDIMRGT